MTERLDGISDTALETRQTILERDLTSLVEGGPIRPPLFASGGAGNRSEGPQIDALVAPALNAEFARSVQRTVGARWADRGSGSRVAGCRRGRRSAIQIRIRLSEAAFR